MSCHPTSRKVPTCAAMARLYGKLFLNTVPQQLFGSQHLIHRAGAESLQVESDEFESKAFEHGRELAGHLGGQGPGKLFTRDLNPHDFPRLAHAALPQPPRPYCAFAAL